MRKMILQLGTVLALSLLAANVMAAVSPQEANKLGTSLTPLGAEKAGNADGSIPAWTGGIPKNAGAVDSKGFLADPFANEKPLFVITAATVDKYKDKLSDGQVAMFKRYPETYRIPVYPSHRTVALPAEIYESAKRSALNVTPINDGNGLANFTGNRYYAFPIPKNGVEVIWNHVTRYHGGNLRRTITQATPQSNGDFTVIRFKDEVAVPSLLSDLKPGSDDNVLNYFKQEVTAPARLAGNVLLVHETLDQVKEPRKAWIYNAGQRRVRRAPQVAYDGVGTSSDGLRTTDNFDMFSGAPDRYDWKLIGKKEMYIPYNSYKLDSPNLKYTDVIKAGHINQDLTRYELHRVWEVVATVKPSERHVYAKRHMYIDEDSWQVALADHYDGRGQLWRVAEGHAQFYYDHQVPAYTVEALYDLIAGRYIALGMKNEEKRSFEFNIDAKAGDYTPAALRSTGVR
ncbi:MULTISPECIES: DUF1329 domain-containing protein [Pseudomonas]|uniref:DUF1329 domain-containing protein n=1 Tax=Pseudomonas monachiensis TaxID=3060212 RepID=A0ABW9H3M1_9PSED|nr:MULTISPECIES: DUF1329 domain-containing protein [unclassified Pseudomonas]KRA85824.1 hypothetical protein ASD91_20690 [Pseudomonas sp. Root68]KRB71498.1 hypothetical protein ASD95_21755 [Pseudomonas sp. Root71]